MHLAAMTDIFIIAYFSSGRKEYFHPITNKYTIIKHELGCSGCGDMCFTEKLPKPCIEKITPEEIFEKVKEVLKEND
jgi:ADP-heptose:LPS heptosyltransferase